MFTQMCTQKNIIMKILTTREFRSETKAYFELAEKERVSVKRGKKFVNLIVSNKPDSVFFDENWVKDFLAIPDQYRCNPFDISPSGDVFWADKRNVDRVVKAVESSEKQPVEGKTIQIKDTKDIWKSIL